MRIEYAREIIYNCQPFVPLLSIEHTSEKSLTSVSAISSFPYQKNHLIKDKDSSCLSQDEYVRRKCTAEVKMTLETTKRQ